ncbi:Ldh family oxidoreductase [Sodalis sp. RH21]|uniref:Ldh family oxidoreductase n=1 Tax=unclassified Sodalis (in: enterobacteria) TaxID=2636512 RepID=UPI0039B4AA98
MHSRYDMRAIADLGRDLLIKHGMPRDKAEAVAEVLVRGEGFGKTTHGLALLPAYLAEIARGGMNVAGEPRVIHDHGACLTWDGRKLPGPWLVQQAVRTGAERAERYGIAIVSLYNSHHTACLSAYLQAATDKGLVIFIALTDPGHSSVAPFGGTGAVMTSNPVALGAPTGDGPVLIDMSTALATNGAVALRRQTGAQFPYPVLLDNQGRPSADPAVMATNPPGTIMPLGGVEAGHKGYALGLMVEILSGCLSGGGRAEPHEGWSASMTITLYSPQAMGGSQAYLKQIDALVRACRDSPPKPGFERVMLPGERALNALKDCQNRGIPLPVSLCGQLDELARAHGLTMPTPVANG